MSLSLLNCILLTLAVLAGVWVSFKEKSGAWMAISAALGMLFLHCCGEIKNSITVSNLSLFISSSFLCGGLFCLYQKHRKELFERIASDIVLLADPVLEYLKRGKVKVLLVEDSPMDIEMFKKQLNEENALTHYEIEVVSDFEEAKRVIKKKQHNIVVLDWNLGHDRTGLDLAKELHKEDIFFPFIIYTAHEEDYSEAIKEGCQGWINKQKSDPRILDATILLALKNWYNSKDNKR